MKILICSLQVSHGSSKGHLHPALEVGIELKHRGHQVALLPLPSSLNQHDLAQVTRCQLELIPPPQLPPGLPLSAAELAHLAKDPATTHRAFHSFLVAPLTYQFEHVLKQIENFAPDLIFYDLLVYAAPLAARLLSIPDMGFCAGLKLIAPATLTSNYEKLAQQLLADVKQFFAKFTIPHYFHNLELLATTKNIVFTPPQFIDSSSIPVNTALVGSLPISQSRCETDFEIENLANFIVLCFGSVLDPADYPELTKQIIATAQLHGLTVVISTQKSNFFLHKNVIACPYLPLSQLLKKAKLFIHHGGANTFSESFRLGVAQLIIPLCNDQPIQAALLQKSKAGFAIDPNHVTQEKLNEIFIKFLDQTDPIHQQIKNLQTLFTNCNGAVVTADLIEKTETVKVAS